MGKLFGTDGIRGVANRHPMTPQMGLKLGKAIPRFLGKGRVKAVMGRDTRVSGPMLEYAVASGLMSEGADVASAGIIPTPAVAYLTRELGADVGIVISASHNPYEHNGFKVFSAKGTKLTEDEELRIEKIIFSIGEDDGIAQVGGVKQMGDTVDKYVDFLVSQFPNLQDLSELRVVIDCANGATYNVAPDLFERLIAHVISLGINPDGRNINDGCGSQHPEDLGAKVVETGASVGLAFDGDGDRLIAVDEKGRVLTGDQLLAIFARMLKEKGELKGNVVVSTVMSNIGLKVALRSMGIDLIAADVGDRNVYQKMIESGAVLGGEESGHIILLSHHSTGDGMLSALQLVSAMRYFERPLSELAQLMEVFPQVLVNVPVKRKTPLSELPMVQEIIGEVEDKLGDKGRVLVRYSGTESLCRVMVEGEDRDKAQNYAQEIASAVAQEVGK